MALPEINAPDVSPEAAPAIPTAVPSQGALGSAALGRGLTEIGESLFSEGFREYHLAAEAKAQEMETAFQTKALDIRDKYRNLYNENAVKGHGEASHDLEEARKAFIGQISSKYGRALYNNNSLRNMRFVQESMDAHFEQQNRSYQALQFKQGEQSDITFVAGLAADRNLYNVEAIEAKINERHDKALQFATSHGIENAEEFATNSTHKVTHALFAQLLDKKSGRDPALVKSELEKYSKQGMVDATIQKDAQGALNGSEVSTWVSNAMANMIRKDYDGGTDPEGHIPHAQVVTARSKLDPKDPLYEKKVEGLENAWRKDWADHELAGKELENTIIRKGMQDGKFVIPENDLNYQKYARLYPEKDKALQEKTQEHGYRAEQRVRLGVKQGSNDAYGATRLYIDKLSTEDARNMTPATVEAMMRENYHGPGVEPDKLLVDRVLQHLKLAQTGKLDPVEHRFGKIINDALEQGYKGDLKKVHAAENRAYYIVADLYDESKRKGKPLSETELREALVKEFTRPSGLFNWARSGESYEPKAKSRVDVISDEASYKALPSGARYRKPGDPTDQWRVKP
jgi:hypothetical protein